MDKKPLLDADGNPVMVDGFCVFVDESMPNFLNGVIFGPSPTVDPDEDEDRDDGDDDWEEDEDDEDWDADEWRDTGGEG